MLERLEIKNFQKNSHLRVIFDPQVTTFVGDTDAGKSSALRGLLWLITNRPIGTDFIRWGADTAAVRLGVDGRRITRKRGKRVNRYFLDKQPFSAVGRDVPPEIKALLNISEVNFQWQHDAPFWFSDTPGVVSKKLNAIVNLEIIDKTLANLAAAERKANLTLEIANDRLEAANKELKALAPVPEIVGDWEWVKRLEQRAADKRARAAGLRMAATNARNHARRAKRLAGAAQAGRAVVALGTAAADARERAETLAAAVAGAAARVPRVPDISALSELRTQTVVARTFIDSLRSDINGTSVAVARARDASKELEYAKLDVLNYTGPERICPTCGQPVNT